MEYGPVIIIGAVGVAIVFTILVRRLRGHEGHPVERKPFLTDHEKAFHAKLLRAVEAAGSYRVHAQVAMGAIIKTKSGLDQSAERSLRNRFDRKIIDFVIVDGRMEIVALIELDDRTHDVGRDAERDRLTASAGYVTIRMRNGYRTSISDISDTLRPVFAQRR